MDWGAACSFIRNSGLYRAYAVLPWAVNMLPHAYPGACRLEKYEAPPPCFSTTTPPYLFRASFLPFKKTKFA
jgi:hypothetical protein